MAVFTPISFETLLAIRRTYDLEDIVSFIGLDDGDCETTYLAISGQRQIVVTLFESAVDQAELERAFQAMEVLAAAGVPCPATIRTPTGAPCADVNGRTIALVEGITGNCNASPNPDRCFDLGRNLAKIHTTLLTARPLHPDARDGLPRGWLHGSLNRDNVFFVADSVTGIINFRLRHEGALIDEIADLIAEWCLADGALDWARSVAFVDGYERERALADRERDVLPLLSASQMLRRAAKTNQPIAPAFDHASVASKRVHAIMSRMPGAGPRHL